MIIRFVVLAAAALTLAACGDGKGRCKAPELPKVPPAAARAAAVGPDGAARLDAQTALGGARICVQRYAWKLAKSEDKTPVVADAVVTACDTAIAKVTEAERAAYGTRDLNVAHEANVKSMTRWATLYLVQYRAGVCD
jgi:Flp pilus assembly protein TadG